MPPIAAPLEKTQLTLGFIALTDCAPLVVAAERGLFADEGLQVTLSREASWSNIRDKVAVGLLDGAHMLASMPLAATLGFGGIRQPTVTAMVLTVNGAAITISEALYRRLRRATPAAAPVDGRALKALIAADQAAGAEPLTFAVVYPVSAHAHVLRYWMAEAGIDPDRDVQLTVVPPPLMAAHLEQGLIDGFCVGEPWNGKAVHAGIGRVLATSSEICGNSADKVFGVTRAWAERHPATLRALIRALIRAAAWLEDPANHPAAAEILAQPGYVGVAPELLLPGLSGRLRVGPPDAVRTVPDFLIFHRYAANFPWTSQVAWTLTQMLRWGQVDRPVAITAAAASCCRPDLYRAAAADLGIACPTSDHKAEGRHTTPWTLTDATRPIAMGPDRFLDGRPFDPADPVGYLRGFAIHHLRVDPAALAAANPGPA